MNATKTLTALTMLAAAALAGCTIQLDDGDSTNDDASSQEGTPPAGDSPVDEPPADDPPADDPPADDPPADDPPAFEPPEVVSIRIVDALIRPWDINQEYWDSTSTVSGSDVVTLASLLGYADPYTSAVGFVFDFIANGVAPPDPYGSVQIFIGGAWQEQLEIDLSTQWQTINPSWRIGWDHVRLEENIRIQLKLTDNDDGWSADDYIGTVQLNYDDLVGAAEANQIYNVATHDQGQGTLLFVGISVVAESGSAQ